MFYFSVCTQVSVAVGIIVCLSVLFDLLSAYPIKQTDIQTIQGGGRVVRRCWGNFQYRGVLLIWITVGQGPIVLAVGAGGSCLDNFSLIYHLSFLSPSLWETARYRLKYCLKGPLSLTQPTNQPTNKQSIHPSVRRPFVCPSIHPSP